jgi:hypothetical protein
MHTSPTPFDSRDPRLIGANLAEQNFAEAFETITVEDLIALPIEDLIKIFRTIIAEINTENPWQKLEQYSALNRQYTALRNKLRGPVRRSDVPKILPNDILLQGLVARLANLMGTDIDVTGTPLSPYSTWLLMDEDLTATIAGPPTTDDDPRPIKRYCFLPEYRTREAITGQIVSTGPTLTTRTPFALAGTRPSGKPFLREQGEILRMLHLEASHYPIVIKAFDAAQIAAIRSISDWRR